MTKLTNEELLYRYDFLWARDGFSAKEAAEVRELRVEILQRMAEGAAGEAAPPDQWPLNMFCQNHIDTTLSDGNVSDPCPLCALSGDSEAGSASTAGPRPRCPKCGGDELSIASGIVACSCWSCDYEADFLEFFAAAPVEDTKEKV